MVQGEHFPLSRLNRAKTARRRWGTRVRFLPSCLNRKGGGEGGRGCKGKGPTAGVCRGPGLKNVNSVLAPQGGLFSHRHLRFRGIDQVDAYLLQAVLVHFKAAGCAK